MTRVSETTRPGRRRATSTPEEAQHELIINWISYDGADAAPTICALYPHLAEDRVQSLVDEVVGNLHRARTLEADRHHALPVLYGESGNDERVQFRLDKELTEADQLVAEFVRAARASDPAVA